MTATTIESHIGRIERAIALMAERLNQDETPSLDDMASAAAMSKYHFHRVYRLLAGETCGETLQRLKLARGAAALKQPDISITDAALFAGYSSSQAFAKALRETLALPASRLRADPERLAAAIADLSVPRPGNETAAPLRLEIASFDPFEIVAIQTRGLYPDLYETYGFLFKAAGGPANVRAILGWPMGDLVTDGVEAHVFWSGLQLTQRPAKAPKGTQFSSVAGGLFLLSRHTGSYASLLDSLDLVYRTALNLPGLELADTPPLFHYLDDPEEAAELALRTDIYLPVEFNEGSVSG